MALEQHKENPQTTLGLEKDDRLRGCQLVMLLPKL